MMTNLAITVIVGTVLTAGAATWGVIYLFVDEIKKKRERKRMFIEQD